MSRVPSPRIDRACRVGRARVCDRFRRIRIRRGDVAGVDADVDRRCAASGVPTSATPLAGARTRRGAAASSAARRCRAISLTLARIDPFTDARSCSCWRVATFDRAAGVVGDALAVLRGRLLLFERLALDPELLLDQLQVVEHATVGFRGRLAVLRFRAELAHVGRVEREQVDVAGTHVQRAARAPSCECSLPAWRSARATPASACAICLRRGTTALCACRYCSSSTSARSLFAWIWASMRCACAVSEPRSPEGAAPAGAIPEKVAPAARASRQDERETPPPYWRGAASGAVAPPQHGGRW